MVTGAPKAFPERNDLRLDGEVVVRRHDGAAPQTIAWIHRFLERLAFTAPKPVPYFDGASVAEIDGVVWGALSYVEGDVIGWSSEPTMFELGAFLATFHDAAADVEMEGQQSPAYSIDAVAPPGHSDRPRQVIHGDPTNHNVLAHGSRARPSGIIDFGNACIDVALFDVGCALWRSGRPSQDAQEFDGERIAQYVDGYSTVRPLTDEDRGAVVGYVRARGLQIIAKQEARGVREDGPRRKLAWLDVYADQLVEAVLQHRTL
jgi:Ser/Thr protein kinase RdoA (MazF antagonist)